MMKRTYLKGISLLFVLFLAIGLTGCSKGAKLQYDNKSDIEMLKEWEVLEEIERLNLPNEVRMSLSVVYDIETLKADGIVETVRYNNDKFYSVTPVEGGKYLFLLYEEKKEGYYVIDGFLASSLVDKILFEDISKGMKREEIIKRDSSSCVFENYSYHRFTDKSIMKIEYELVEEEYIVSEFHFLEEPVSVLDYLISEDFEKIT